MARRDFRDINENIEIFNNRMRLKREIYFRDGSVVNTEIGSLRVSYRTIDVPIVDHRGFFFIIILIKLTHW